MPTLTVDDAIRFVCIGEFGIARSALKEATGVTSSRSTGAAVPSTSTSTSYLEAYTPTDLPTLIASDVIRIAELWWHIPTPEKERRPSALSSNAATSHQQLVPQAKVSLTALTATCSHAQQLIANGCPSMVQDTRDRWAGVIAMYSRVPTMWRRCCQSLTVAPAGKGVIPPFGLFTSAWSRECRGWASEVKEFQANFPIGDGIKDAPSMMALLPVSVATAMLQVDKCMDTLVVNPNPITSGIALAHLQRVLVGYAAGCEQILAATPSRPATAASIGTSPMRSTFIVGLDSILRGLVCTAQVLFGELVPSPMVDIPSRAAANNMLLPTNREHARTRSDVLLAPSPSSDSASNPTASKSGSFLSNLFGGGKKAAPAQPKEVAASQGQPQSSGPEGILQQRALGEIVSVLGQSCVIGVLVQVRALSDTHPVRCWNHNRFTCSVDTGPDDGPTGGMGDYAWCSWYPKRVAEGTYRTILASAVWKVMDMASTGRRDGEDWDGEGRILYCVSPEEGPIKDSPFIMVARSDKHPDFCSSPMPLSQASQSSSAHRGAEGTTTASTDKDDAKRVAAKAKSERDSAARKVIDLKGPRVRSALTDLHSALMLSWVPHLVSITD